MNTLKEEICDHIDRNPLNNLKSNLRKCTKTTNSYNRSKQISELVKFSSKFKGVSFKESKNKYDVSLMKDNKIYKCGAYRTEVEAAFAYNQLAIKHFGEFAALNEFTEEENDILELLSKKSLGEQRNTSGVTNVEFDPRYEMWGWRKMIMGKLYRKSGFITKEEAEEYGKNFLEGYYKQSG